MTVVVASALVCTIKAAGWTSCAILCDNEEQCLAGIVCRSATGTVARVRLGQHNRLREKIARERRGDWN